MTRKEYFEKRADLPRVLAASEKKQAALLHEAHVKFYTPIIASVKSDRGRSAGVLPNIDKRELVNSVLAIIQENAGEAADAAEKLFNELKASIAERYTIQTDFSPQTLQNAKQKHGLKTENAAPVTASFLRDKWREYQSGKILWLLPSGFLGFLGFF